MKPFIPVPGMKATEDTRDFLSYVTFLEERDILCFTQYRGTSLR